MTATPPSLAAPEVQLLLACARTVLDPSTRQRIETLLAGQMDWTRVIALGAEHCILTLVHRSLSVVGTDHVPTDVCTMLHNRSQFVGRRNLIHTGELIQVLVLLEEQGIAAIPYKGAILAASAYGDLGLRQFDDLDILINKTDFPRARDLLRMRGYTSQFEPGSAEESNHLGAHHDFGLMRHDLGLMIELQWAVIQRPFVFPATAKWLWSNVERFPLGGRQVLNLRPETLLLTLCVHGSKHLWGRLLWLCDVAEVVRMHPALNWSYLQRQAAEQGVTRMLGLGLVLAQELLGAPIDACIIAQAAGDPAVCRLVSQVRAGMFSDSHSLARVIEDAPLFYLRMLDRWSDRMQLCLHLYPTLLHPIRLVRTYGFSPIRDLFGL
ncbi:MAG: hypothetical protein NVSMB42_10890 [Herpetosiphon sp.]